MKLMYAPLALGVMLAAGCASRAAQPDADSARRGGRDAPVTSTASGVSRISERVVYFAFDSADLPPDSRPVLERWAAWLAGNEQARVRVEGHADERGTREYNVGLGERRATAVADALTARGVNEDQISVVSYGEDQPVNPRHDAEAWAQNRRVEIAD